MWNDLKILLTTGLVDRPLTSTFAQGGYGGPLPLPVKYGARTMYNTSLRSSRREGGVVGLGAVVRP
jgi:hypothetical protein